jgi:tRNA 5-methylaminomethyl-2-thiouridine biosynthesis bifunctional protein
MPRLPAPPRIAFEPDGYPRDLDHEDGFYSRSGGLEESETVFLGACGLPERWRDRTAFTIAELGFGTGLNVLAAIRLWRATARPDSWLHVVTFEAHPMEQQDAARALAAWPELSDLTKPLLARWPVRASGIQRLTFDDWRVTLTLHVGPAEELLPKSRFHADAWFLDGFAPSRNPQMWSPAHLASVYDHAAPGCVVGTYSAARSVRDGLAAAGFSVSRLEGHGHKKHRLHAIKPSGEASPRSIRPRTALIVGGGIAGAVAASTLAGRGLSVTVIDPDPCGRFKASNNPAALVMPRLDRGDTPAARFHRAAFLMASDRLKRLPDACFQPAAVTERPRTPRDGPRMADLISDPPLPPSMLGADQAGNLVHLGGGIVFPNAVRGHLLNGIPVIDQPVAAIRANGAGWGCEDATGARIADADICVLACGPQIGELAAGFGLVLEGRAGQLSLSETVQPLAPSDLPLAGGAYALPFEQWLLYGATFDPWALDGPPPEATAEAHGRNLAGLSALAPSLAAAVDPGTTWGRASVRVATPDRLPLAGELAPGLHALGALGSRGFSTAWLCGEVIASHILCEPGPLDDVTLDAIAPLRFARRQTRAAGHL